METPRPDADFFDSAYQTRAPWDIGVPQPDLIVLFEEHPPQSPVLDVGCGTGDLALSLAKQGLSVLGIDLAEAAIQQAKAKADTQPLLEFRVADGLQLDQIPEQVNTVVDSGFFHIFGPPEREQFVNQLEVKLPVGGRYYMLGFAISPPMPNAPKEVREEAVSYTHLRAH